MMTLDQVLNTILSPDKMGDYDANSLAQFLVDNGIVKTKTDVNRLIIEGIQKAYKEDDEFPIHYYTKEEEMPEENKVCENVEALTDQYVDKMKAGE